MASETKAYGVGLKDWMTAAGSFKVGGVQAGNGATVLMGYGVDEHDVGDAGWWAW